MIFRQVLHDDLGCASYLIGDEDAGVAAVVDPKLDIGEYLRLARYLGVSLEHVLETRNHADPVSATAASPLRPGRAFTSTSSPSPAKRTRPSTIPPSACLAVAILSASRIRLFAESSEEFTGLHFELGGTPAATT